jgi:hypothetical protein
MDDLGGAQTEVPSEGGAAARETTRRAVALAAGLVAGLAVMVVALGVVRVELFDQQVPAGIDWVHRLLGLAFGAAGLFVLLLGVVGRRASGTLPTGAALVVAGAVVLHPAGWAAPLALALTASVSLWLVLRPRQPPPLTGPGETA